MDILKYLWRSLSGLVVEWILRGSPEPEIQVRFLSRPPFIINLCGLITMTLLRLKCLFYLKHMYKVCDNELNLFYF